MTLEQWLIEQTSSYERLESPPISIFLNDELIEAKRWHRVMFKPSDRVEIYREPKGTDPFSITYALFKGAQAVMKMMVPKMPGMPATGATGQGNPLTEASAKGNKVKLGDTIRQIAGWQKTFPSYLSEPRRWFAAPREQWVEMLLYVGWGSYDIPITKIKVGETPLISLGAEAEYTIYPPGADMSADPTALLWYNVDEVGTSSSGAAGLELTVSSNLTASATASAYRFAADTIAIPEGAGAFPEDWESGLVAQVLSPYEYTVIDGGEGRDSVRGDLAMLNPFAGMLIEVAGANQGNYIVNSYTPYTPAIPPSTGSASTLTGSAAPERYDFDVTPLTFSVSVGATPYSVTLNTAATDLSGLVAAINTALGVAPLVASSVGGRLRVTEKAPFSGLALSATEGVVVFGAAPVSITGSPASSGTPEQLAEMTLDYDGGQPVNGLALGVGLATIGPRGLLYRIVTFSESLLVVDRLTSSGEVDEDWPGFTASETVGGEVSLDTSNLEGGYRGPFIAAPESELVTAFEYEVFYASGLYGTHPSGKLYKVGGIHSIEYRDSALAGAWTAQEVWDYASSRDSQGFTHRIDLPYPMRPEVRIKKIVKKQGGNATSEYQDDVTWYGLKGLRQASPTSYQGMTVITLRIRGGDRLSAQSESQVSLEATRILPLRSGGAWQVPGPTRDIVPFCLSALKSLGYTDDEIDLEEFDLFHEACHAAGQFYDESIDDTSTAKEILNNALACGWGELTISNGLIKPVRDVPRAVFEREYGPKTQTYSPQNIVGSLKISGPLNSINDFDGVDVEFYSSKSWSWETVECRWAGDQGLKIEKIKLPGVTDRDRAYQWGMRRRGHQLFRTETYEWSTDLDGRNSGYLSFCAVASDTPGLCQSAVLLGVETVGGGVVLESSEPLDWIDGATHKVGVRRLDGTLSGPYTATRLDDYRVQVDELDFVPVIDSVDLDPPHLLFGPADKWAYPVLVTSADPSKGGVAMKGMPYDSRVYTYDNATAPEAA